MHIVNTYAIKREHLPLLTRCTTRDVEIRPYTELYSKFLVRNTAIIKIIAKLIGFPKTN